MEEKEKINENDVIAEISNRITELLREVKNQTNENEYVNNIQELNKKILEIKEIIEEKFNVKIDENSKRISKEIRIREQSKGETDEAYDMVIFKNIIGKLEMSNKDLEKIEDKDINKLLNLIYSNISNYFEVNTSEKRENLKKLEEETKTSENNNTELGKNETEKGTSVIEKLQNEANENHELKDTINQISENEADREDEIVENAKIVETEYSGDEVAQAENSEDYINKINGFDNQIGNNKKSDNQKNETEYSGDEVAKEKNIKYYIKYFINKIKELGNRIGNNKKSDNPKNKTEYLGDGVADAKDSKDYMKKIAIWGSEIGKKDNPEYKSFDEISNKFGEELNKFYNIGKEGLDNPDDPNDPHGDK